MLGGELAFEIRVLAKHGKGVREIAREVGADPEDVFHILHHLAANERNVRMTKSDEPAGDGFSAGPSAKS